MNLCRSNFDALVQVYLDASTDDGAGGQVQTYTLKTSIWCFIDEGTQNENLDRDGLETQGGIILYTNYRDDIITKDRLELDGGFLNVTSVKRVDKRKKSAYRGEFLRIDTDSSVWFTA